MSESTARSNLEMSLAWGVPSTHHADELIAEYREEIGAELAAAIRALPDGHEELAKFIEQETRR